MALSDSLYRMSAHSPVRVAQLCRVFPRPTETFVVNQATSIQNAEITVFCHTRTPSSPLVSLNITEVGTLLGPWARWFQKQVYYRYFRLFSAAAVKALTARLIAGQIDVIHAHFLVDARFFLRAIRASAKPLIVSAYGYDVSSFPRSLLGLGRRYLSPVLQQADLILAMSEDMKRDLINIGCPEQKIRIHYHGINCTRFSYPDKMHKNPGAPLKVLFCGRLTEKKGLIYLLKAIQALENRRDTNLELDVVGDGEERKQLKDFISQQRLSTTVNFLGHIPHDSSRLVDIYHNADIFVLPSCTSQNGDKEGIPGTIIEAMASGLPVISTYHAGIPEVIDNGVSGLLVPERDFATLAEALNLLIQNPSTRARLGTAAHKKAMRELSLEQRSLQLERLYLEVAAKAL